MKTTIVCFCLFLALVSATSSGEEDRTFHEPADEIFAALGVERGACSDTQNATYAAHVAVRCGTTSEPFKSFKKTWRKAVKPLTGHLRWDGAPWRKVSETGRRMQVVFDGLPVEIAADFEDGSISVAWPQAYPGCHAGYEVTWFARTNDVLAHKPELKVPPEFPEQARVQRTGGAVMGSFLLDTAGNVVDVCVRAVNPAGFGFERATLEALERSTFTPATRDGHPTSIAAYFFHEFSFGLDGSLNSIVVRDFFENSRLAAAP